MLVTINDREYELKELTKEEAKTYIGKEVYVWNDAVKPKKRKLLEVFTPECMFQFCILCTDEVSVDYFMYCAPVPEEWYVYETSDNHFLFDCDEQPSYKIVDHGSHDYCVYKARELNEQKEPAEHRLTYYELTQLLKCFGVESSYMQEDIHNTMCYVTDATNKALSEGYKIRYKCGEWMPATRETVWKWWGEEVPNSDIARFVSFMGWDEDKE